MRYWIEGHRPGGGAQNVTSIWLFDKIGNEAQSGTRWEQLARDVTAARGNRIECHIHSDGGSAEGALHMYELLRTHPDVVTFVDGSANSGASIVAQAGLLRSIARTGSMLIHCCRVPGAQPSHPKERRELNAAISQLDRTIAAIYAERSGRGTVESWLRLMENNTKFTAEQALRAGLVDAIVGNSFVPPAVALHKDIELGRIA